MPMISPKWDRRSAPPVLKPRTLAVVTAAAVLLCWPMLILGAPLIFFDSATYLTAGRAVFQALHVALAEPPDPVGGPGGITTITSQAETIRSIPYSVFAYITSLSPLGFVGTTLVQTILVLLVVVALAGRAAEAPRRDIAVALLFCMLLTTLPWYASYLMPDIFAAGVILYAAVLVSSFDALANRDRIALLLIVTLATASHYGHIPLAAITFALALAIRMVERRPNFGIAALAAAVPIVVTLGANLVGSAAVLDTASAAPRRLPVLLARSIEDGPARWYLQENCAEDRYEICRIFDEIPSTVEDTLWGQSGLHLRATAEQFQRIREEEPIIIWHSFLEYPLEQIWSLMRNAVVQFVSVGAAEFYMTGIGEDGLPEVDRETRSGGLRGPLGVLWVGTTLAGVAAIAIMGAKSGFGSGSERQILAVVVVGLIVNAAVFGGLSAPADRYQGRVIWIVPVIAALFWLERRRRSAEHVSSQ